MAEDYYGGDYLQDIYEAALIEIGGQSLLEDAQDEACAYVDQHYPWDGRGDEPAERVSAYCAVPCSGPTWHVAARRRRSATSRAGSADPPTLELDPAINYYKGNE